MAAPHCGGILALVRKPKVWDRQVEEQARGQYGVDTILDPLIQRDTKLPSIHGAKVQTLLLSTADL